MKLYYGPFSPYVRMVRAVAEARGLSSRIELVDARAQGAAYEAVNPLNKVPALLTDDGEVLIESRLICRYLDEMADGPGLYPDPADGSALRHVLQQEALIHGVLDAAILRFNEERREEAERSSWWIGRQDGKIGRGLALMERESTAFCREGTVIPIVLGCLLGFVDRPDWALVTYDWRPDHPRLAAWFDRFAATPVMTETESVTTP